MVIYNLKDLIHKKSVMTNTKITYTDIEKDTGVSRTTLTRMSSIKRSKVNVDTVEKLCIYFNCTPNDLMTIAPDTPAHPAEKQPTM